MDRYSSSTRGYAGDLREVERPFDRSEVGQARVEPVEASRLNRVAVEHHPRDPQDQFQIGMSGGRHQSAHGTVTAVADQQLTAAVRQAPLGQAQPMTVLALD